MYEIKLEIKKVKRSWVIFQGERPLSQKFKKREMAIEDLQKNKSFYEYWAGSAYAAGQYKPSIVVEI